MISIENNLMSGSGKLMIQQTIETYYPYLQNSDPNRESLYLYRLRSLWGQELLGEGDTHSDEASGEKTSSFGLNDRSQYRCDFSL
jgi:hypothetical protein